jgi:hypothetical protein
MSRLIDADKIIDSLGNSDMDFAIGAVIDEQPTVFDIDKVVEQLENYLFEKYCIEGDTTIDEIVKGGGVE